MKDYGLGPLVEGKACFNQNVQQIKKKVIMNVQLKTLSSILLFRVVRNSPFWTKGHLKGEFLTKVVLKKMSSVEHS